MDDIAGTVDSTNDNDRSSRRDRLKDVVLRTRGKWKKEKEKVTQPQDDFKLSDDVNDFLAAGRKPAATTSVRQIADDIQHFTPSPRPSTSDSRDSGQPSPRGISVPKLDISQSRWPSARTVIASTEPRSESRPDPRPNPRPDPRPRSFDHLSPDYHDRHNKYERSRSFNSALARKGSKPRGLSVTFLNGPPTIIGEGGDESQIPPSEISRVHKQRSRSLSPYLDRPSSQISNGSNGQSPVRRKPVPSPSPPGELVNAESEHSMFQPRPVRRAQTGFNGQTIETPFVTKTLEQQLQDAFRLGDQLQQSSDPFTNSPSQQGNRFQPEPTRQFNTIKPVIMTNQIETGQHHYKPVQQSEYQRVSPVHHPDLQQSCETSTKLPPPKVQNFYAQLNQQKSDLDSESVKRLSALQRRETAPRSQPQPSMDFSNQPNSFAQRVQNLPQKTPEGWI